MDKLSSAASETRTRSLRRLVMHTLLAHILLVAAPLALAAQKPSDRVDFEAAGSPIAPAPADRRIQEALRLVSPAEIRSNIEALLAFGNRSTLSSTESDLPPGTGITAASVWIRSQFEAYSQACNGCLEVNIDEFVQEPEPGGRSRFAKPTPLRNVYAILRGTDPVQAKRMYLITGHYDTRETDVMDTHSPAPGANDDSSGTAVSLEAARVLSRYRFPATLIFVAVAGEEQGLNGSGHLAKLARDQGWQLEGVLNNDIVGGDTTPGETLQSKSRVRVFSQGLSPTTPPEAMRQALTLGIENDTPSRELARQVLDVGRTYFPQSASPAKGSPQPFHPILEFRLDRYLRGGDHRSFSDLGFPAVRFTEWRENFNHQHQHVRTEGGIEYGDLLKFDDFAYIAQTARLNVATLATLASSPGTPQNVRIVTTNLDNNSILKWDAPAAAGPRTHYQVVWRPTAASDWQYAAEAARYGATSTANVATLPVSKDNVLFGVRACDAETHCSPAVTPIPERR